MTFNLAGGQVYTLSGSISSTATSITLSSFTEPVTGTVYTMANLNTDIAYGTIAPKTTSSEFISFTGITANANGTATLTGVTRGLAKKYPFTTDASYKLPHSGQSQFILSDAPQAFNKFVSVENTETIAGVKTFSSFPITPSSAPTTDYQTANKKYVDDTAIAGAPDATLTVKGIVEIGTTAEIDAGTSTGGTGASLAVRPDQLASSIYGTRLPTAGQKAGLPGNNTDIAVGAGNLYVTQTGLQHNAEKYAADAGANDTYVITLSPVPTSYTNGMVVYFKANTANTGTATINVNSLGAKTIVKYVNTTLADGDIAAGQFCTLIYDGTNFVLQNPIANIISFTSTSDVSDGPAATSTQTITHGLGRIPVIVRLTAYGPQAGVVSTGVYDTSGNRCVYRTVAGGVITVAKSTSISISLYDDQGTDGIATGVVQNVGATSFDIAWTLTQGVVTTNSFLWEAQ